MTKRTFLVNVLLLLACVYLGRVVQSDFAEFDETHKVVAIEAETLESGGAGGGPPVVTTRSPVNPADFNLVSEKNLFLESRSLQTATAPPPVEVAPPLNPKPLLMGVATVGGEPRAFVQSLRAQPGQKSTRILRLGEVYEGYRVSQIQRSRVELTYTSPSGSVTTQVLDISDPANRGARPPAGKTPLAPSQVISVGGAQAAAAAPGQQPGAPGQAVDDQGRRVIRTPFGDVVAPPGLQNPAARTLPVNPANQNELLMQQERQFQQTQPRPQASPTRRNEVIDDQGRRVIRTPFGDIIRPAETPPPAAPPTTIPPVPEA